MFISANLFVVFDLITENRLHFVVRVGENGFVKPTPENSFQPISQFVFGSTPAILPRLIVYSFM